MRERPRPRRDADGLAPSLAALERAAAYELPYGRWKGYSVAQAAERDVRYLRWAARTLDGIAGRMVRAFVAGLDADVEGCNVAATSVGKPAAGGDRSAAWA